ncbi:YhcN/YlaJ family sporulation lipoprotein [Bacillus methanolicus]|uniref:YhcN/YlaJ family sporulation lipoprotein n=1 Tax=Bacillus methanolicus TaxID=1471 RepID=UPI00200E3889|nr:YhcN/YlaJ family sporulation lipoprotein [Bacillus methanolicus]
MKRRRIVTFFMLMMITIVCLFGAGCEGNEVGKKSSLALIKTTNPSPQVIGSKQKDKDVAEKVKKDVMSYKEIFDVAVVKGKKDILVVYKVKHLHRFRMKKIEKNINKILEKKYPDENFTVSSDYKIFLEAVQLKEKMKDPDYSEKDAEKRLKRIISLKKELT